MMGNKLHKCPCCGEGDIEELYDICLICGWENDPIQNEAPDFVGGANHDSLESHRANFQELRKTDRKYQWCNTWKH